MRTLTSFLIALFAGLVLTMSALAGDVLSMKVASATAAPERNGLFVIRIDLAPESREALAKFTAARVGQKIELRAGGESLLTAVLRDPLQSGQIEVSGNYSRAAAEAIAGKVNSGAAAVEIEATP